MKECIINVCLTAVALSLFKMIIPEGKMKKQTNFLVSCFFLASLVVFFSRGNFDFAEIADFSSTVTVTQDGSGNVNFTDFERQYAAAQAKAVEREMNFRLSQILAKEGLSPKEICTIVNISDNDGISINEIRLVYDKAASNNEADENGYDEQQLETLKKAMNIVQKEVGDGVLIGGEIREREVKR